MPVLVETEAAPSSTSLLRAHARRRAHGVAASRPHACVWLDQHRDEYVVVLGPSLPLDAALCYAEDLRIAGPPSAWSWSATPSTPRLLTRAMHAGARDVVAAGDDDRR